MVFLLGLLEDYIARGVPRGGSDVWRGKRRQTTTLIWAAGV
jgi:hypothetical protein